MLKFYKNAVPIIKRLWYNNYVSVKNYLSNFEGKEVNRLNQILVTEKLYVTPELKRKRRLYKIQFFVAIFLVCLLSSYYIYAEYDRNKSEEVSQTLLAEVKTVDDTVKQDTKNDAIIIVLSEEEANEEPEIEVEVEELSDREAATSEITVGGTTYTTEAIITIPKIDITYPVLTETSDSLLEISVNRYWPKKGKIQFDEVDNYCIVGHNYRNGKMFGRLNELENGDIVEIDDLTGRTLKYEVYKKSVVDPDDTSCTSQRTNGRKELTLITCTNYGTQRLVVKCKQI